MSKPDRIEELMERAWQQLAALRQYADGSPDALLLQPAIDEVSAVLAALGTASMAQQRERSADVAAITGELAHDLGNPLAGISMQAQLILSRIERDGDQPISSAGPQVQRILAEVDRLNGVVKEFAEFAHGQTVDLQPVDVGDLLRSVVARWLPLAAARALTLTLEVPPVVPPVRGDVERLGRAVDHVLQNAIEAVEGPGRIDIRVTLPEPDTIVIAVADTGPGIQPAVQPFRLFESTKPAGLGLGLAIARQIVLAHGGSLDYAPHQPRGTVFYMELPGRRPAV